MFTGEDKWHAGTLARADRDTLLVHPGAASDTLKLLAGDLREFDVSRGTASRLRSGAGWGLVAGVSAAAVAGLATGCSWGDYNGFNQKALNNNNCIGLGPSLGIVLAGTALGAFIGSHTRGERWVKIPLTHLHAGVTLRGASVAISF